MSPLADLDLNLVVFLRELLAERNVTRAAQRIGVTQPAASAALKRLRRHFGDDLLTRTLDGYELTLLGTQLAAQVEPVHIALEQLFATTSGFDPLSTEREFSVLVADYAAFVIGNPLARRLAAQTPRARLHLTTVRETMTTHVSRSVKVMDAVIAPPVRQLQVSEVRSRPLFTDEWVCLVDAGTDIPDRPGREDLAARSWVLPYHRGGASVSDAPATRFLDRIGIRPHVAVRVESYVLVPLLVAGTDRIALVQRRLAEHHLAQGLPVRILPVPCEHRTIEEHLWWHERFDDDPAHQWFREALSAAATAIPRPKTEDRPAP
ncbi:LysR family transcriptional regulator [Streptomyces tagetis]|nr:LysR family transcriptional regulator [Streptomyces sp. RG38]